MFKLYDISALPLNPDQLSLVRCILNAKNLEVPKTFVWEMDAESLQSNYEAVADKMHQMLSSGIVVLFKASVNPGIESDVKLIVGHTTRNAMLLDEKRMVEGC